MNGMIKTALALASVFMLSGIVMAAKTGAGDTAFSGVIDSYPLVFSMPTSSGDIFASITEAELAAGDVIAAGTLTDGSLYCLGPIP